MNHVDTHLVVVILEDEEHMMHVQSDVDRGWYPADDAREERDNLADGTWSAYGVTTARVCDCCDQITESYVTALWGCVVEESNQTGRYEPSELDRIESAHLRDVARELLDEAESVVPA